MNDTIIFEQTHKGVYLEGLEPDPPPADLAINARANPGLVSVLAPTTIGTLPQANRDFPVQASVLAAVYCPEDPEFAVFLRQLFTNPTLWEKSLEGLQKSQKAGPSQQEQLTSLNMIFQDSTTFLPQKLEDGLGKELQIAYFILTVFTMTDPDFPTQRNITLSLLQEGSPHGLLEDSKRRPNVGLYNASSYPWDPFYDGSLIHGMTRNGLAVDTTCVLNRREKDNSLFRPGPRLFDPPPSIEVGRVRRKLAVTFVDSTGRRSTINDPRPFDPRVVDLALPIDESWEHLVAATQLINKALTSTALKVTEPPARPSDIPPTHWSLMSPEAQRRCTLTREELALEGVLRTYEGISSIIPAAIISIDYSPQAEG